MKTEHPCKSFALFVSAVLALGVFGTRASSSQYTVIDLGTLGGIESKAYGINNLGQIVGYSSDINNNYRGFLWDGTMHDMGSLTGAAHRIAYAINDAGQIAGIGYNYGDLQAQGFLSLNAVNAFVADFSGRGTNASGAVAGHLALPGTVTGTVDHACVRSNGVLTDLGTLGGLNSYAYDVNAAGKVVGEAMLSDDSTPHACLWSGTTPIDLGTLGGTKSAAYTINDAGQAAGFSDTASGASHACLFTLNAQGQVVSRTDLGALAAGYSYAYDVNNSGQVVGTSGTAFIYQNGQMSDLNSLLPAGTGWIVASANSINDYGQIAGWGLSWDGKPHALLVTPVESDLATAKAGADGSRLGLPSSTVTAAFDGFFYVEQDNRASGMRVVKPNHGMSVGQRVVVWGGVQTDGDGERSIQALTISPVGSGTIAPVAMTNKALGGADRPGQGGVIGGSGLNTIGLLVTTTGAVTSAGSGFFYIDDGSGVNDESGQGVRVSATGLTLPTVGQHLIVTGICSCVKTSAINRLILVRSQADIRLIP